MIAVETKCSVSERGWMQTSPGGLVRNVIKWNGYAFNGMAMAPRMALQ